MTGNPSNPQPGGGNPAPVAGAANPGDSPIAPDKSAMPEGLPPQFWDSQGNKVQMGELVKSYGELNTFKTQHDERLATLPKTAEDYKIEFKLPDTIKLPEGVQVQIDPKDPRVAAVRALAHQHKLPQDVVSALVQVEAQRQAEEYIAADAHIQAEMKKLGENGPARVTAAEAYLKQAVSKEEYESLRPFIGDATAFSAIEKLISKALTQSVPGAGGHNPAPPKPAELPIEQRWYGNPNGQAHQRTS